MRQTNHDIQIVRQQQSQIAISYLGAIVSELRVIEIGEKSIWFPRSQNKTEMSPMVDGYSV